MKSIFDVHPKEVMFTPSDIGWIVGHSFVLFGPLLRGAAATMFDGKPVGTPDAGVFWRMIEEYRVKACFLAPTAVRAIEKEDFEGNLIKKYDLSTLTGIHLAGERADPATIEWLIKNFPNALINDNWWQTETGSPICSNFLNLSRF